MLYLPPTPPSAATLPDWCRKVAGLINGLLARKAFPTSSAAPAEPEEGDAYYDLTTHKARIWDGSAWNDLF